MEGRGSGRREELDGVRMKELSSALADRVGKRTCQEGAIFLDQRLTYIWATADRICTKAPNLHAGMPTAFRCICLQLCTLLHIYTHTVTY